MNAMALVTPLIGLEAIIIFAIYTSKICVLEFLDHEVYIKYDYIFIHLLKCLKVNIQSALSMFKKKLYFYNN